MEIVKMTTDHVSEIAQLEKLCFGADAWSERSVASELQNKLAHWLVCLDGSRVAGYVGSQTVLGETDMMNIAVHPDYRRRGIAAKLVDALVADLKTMESHCLTLEVRASNAPARALYEQLGFQEIGCRKNYYRSPREDGLILRKEWEI